MIFLIFGCCCKPGAIENICIGVESCTKACGVRIIQYHTVQIVVGVFADYKKLGDPLPAPVFYCVTDIAPCRTADNYRDFSAIVLCLVRSFTRKSYIKVFTVLGRISEQRSVYIIIKPIESVIVHIIYLVVGNMAVYGEKLQCSFIVTLDTAIYSVLFKLRSYLFIGYRCC